MLTTETLRKACRPDTYAAGEQLAHKGKVLRVRQEEQPDGTELLTAQVEGNYGYIHRVQLLLSDQKEGEQTVLSYACGCYERQSGWGLCRHCAAVGIAASGMETAPEAPLPTPVPKRPARKTSGRLAGYMAHYSAAARNLNEGIRPGTVRLEPTVALLEEPGLSGGVSLKIGVTRMYAVRNLVNFVHAVLAGEPAAYGKGLSFVHNRAMLEEQSLRLFDLLQRAVRRAYPDIDQRGDDTVGELRQIGLQGEELSALLRLCLGGQLRTGEGVCPVLEQNPPLRIALEGIPGEGAELRIPTVNLLDGAADTWVYDGAAFYHCSERFCREVLPFYYAVGAVNTQQKTVEEYLSQEDYQTFCGTVLPALEETVAFSEQAVSLEAHRPKPPQFSFYLSAAGEQELHLRPLVSYGEAQYPLFAAGKEYRALEQELAVRELLLRYFDGSEQPEVLVQTEEEGIFLVLSEGIQALRQMGQVLYEGEQELPRLAKSPKVTVGVALKGNLIDLDVQSEELSREELAQLADAYAEKKRYLRLKNGEYLILEDGALKVIGELAEGLGLEGEQLLDAQLPAFRASYLDALLAQECPELEVQRSEAFDALVQRVQSYDDSDCTVPEELNATLRPYQETGYRWLCRMAECGLGGILADDMGLGKTIQVIALLAHRKQRALVVCPASLLYNWDSELRRFAPSLPVQLVRGPATQRAKQIENEAALIFVTSYDFLRRDVDCYREQQYSCLIIDEAQQIRNPETQLAKAVRQVPAEHRFALTGTPIENRLSDLWSIFDFILPGYLFDRKTFRSRIESPAVGGDEAALERLRRMAAPFILRREKEGVLTELPPKVETIRYVELTDQQRLLYLSQEQALRRMLWDEGDGQTGQMQILSALTRLRQLCCAPQLYLEDYDGPAGKLEVCLELLEQAAENGHRTLVFSQFTTMLEELRGAAEARGLSSLFLSGQDSKERRQEMVEQFQAGDYPVFFISLKAGGTGLTLTAADRVIHFDPWWNSAAEDQATDRAHRIGQTETLFVTKLVAKDTIEERIVALQQSKRALSDSILANEALAGGSFDREELLRLLGPERDEA